jgi:hypothetical protein
LFSRSPYLFALAANLPLLRLNLALPRLRQAALLARVYFGLLMGCALLGGIHAAPDGAHCAADHSTNRTRE